MASQARLKAPKGGSAGDAEHVHNANPLTEPPRDSSETKASFITPALKAVGTSAGISGLLAAVGYVVHFSQESFLGVPLSGSSSGFFVLEGARFAADLCLFSFSSFVPLLIFASLVGLIFLISTGARRWGISRRLPAGFWAILFLVVVFSELAIDDLPMVYLSGLLFKIPQELQVGGDLHLQSPLPPPVSYATRLLRDAVVCSRDPKHAGCALGERQPYKEFLQDWFIINLFATILILVHGLRALPRWLKPRIQADGKAPVIPPIWGLGAALLSLALVLELFGLPFAYARTIKQNIFPTAVITLKDAEGKDGESAKNVELRGPQAPTGEGPAAEVHPSPVTDQLWQVLSYGDDRFVLYNKVEAQVWSVPKDIVRTIRIRNEDDVLSNYLLRSAELNKEVKR